LLVKNALDAIDWARLPGPMGPVVERLRRLVESRVRGNGPPTAANTQGIG
jgi:predicted lipid carrier protein YhbT